MAIVEIFSESRIFNPIFDFVHLSIVLVWSSETSLRDITWETWFIIRARWPFFTKASFFFDRDKELFFPSDEGWPKGWEKRAAQEEK